MNKKELIKPKVKDNSNSHTGEEIKEQIIKLTEKYFEVTKKPINHSIVPISGKVYNSDELKNLISASLEGWWTDGKWSEQFEQKLKKYLNVNHVILVNSGSSANLLALSCLTSSRLGNRKLNIGDEIITVAAGFPTTINPIIQLGLVPVFLDVNIPTYNIKIEDLQKALSTKTKAVMVAHTLGNPYDLEFIQKFCKDHNLWLIEDNCDGLGSKYNGKYTGTFGDIATSSFYPAHHITTGEGGAVYTNNFQLNKIVTSMRDWGRDCWCKTGKDNTCTKRFSWKLGNLPEGYDHKYIYSELGYNLKMTDLQASIGAAQMDKLDNFVKKRKENFDYLNKLMKEFEEHFILPVQTKNSQPAWFGYLITIKNNKINRTELMDYLNNNGIATRLLFAGNITKQPYFINNKINYRTIGNLENTDKIMNCTFWIGIYPALDKKHIEYVILKFREYLLKFDE